MKIVGWNLSCRIWRLRHKISRARHFRGHGVHSPYIYGIIRKVFLARAKVQNSNPIIEQIKRYEQLTSRAICEIKELSLYCGYQRSVINSTQQADIIFCDRYCNEKLFEQIITVSGERGSAIIAISPHLCEKFERMVQSAITRHNSTSMDRYDYIIFFNNHLPKQHFRL